MTSGYVELRARSAFSFLEGATMPEDLVLRTAELGYGAIALGDSDLSHPRSKPQGLGEGSERLDVVSSNPVTSNAFRQEA